MTSTHSIRVLVLCAGNIGRSPLAAALLEHGIAAGLDVTVAELPAVGVSVESAGTDAPVGHEASQRGIAFAAARGIDLTRHRATFLTADLLGRADLIYAMDRAQIAGVGSLDIDAVARTLLWAGEGTEIPDPHGESDEFFAAVGAQIEAAVPDRVAEILQMHESQNLR